MLRARRARREDYVGSWLPEPIVSLDDRGGSRAGGAHRRLGRARAARRARDADARRAARVRPARHVRRAVRRDRADRRPDARTRRASSRAARGAACAEPRRAPTPTWRVSASSSTRSSPLHAPATSTRCSPCSIPTSSSASTPGSAAGAPGRRSPAPHAVARQILSRGRACAASPAPRSSTAPPGSSWGPRTGHSQSSGSLWCTTHRGHRHRHRPGQAAPAVSRQGLLTKPGASGRFGELLDSPPGGHASRHRL